MRRTMRGAAMEREQFHKSPPSETFAVISVKANKFTWRACRYKKSVMFLVVLVSAAETLLFESALPVSWEFRRLNEIKDNIFDSALLMPLYF